jgi:hypothetical protein
MNISLLCKWWLKLKNENGLWQQIIHFKYLKGKNVCTVNHRQTDSAMWTDLLKIRSIYVQGRLVKVRDGRKTLFWKDYWLHDKPPSLLFPTLFKLCEQPDISVYRVRSDPSCVTFIRWLVDDLRISWLNILGEIECTHQYDGEDFVIWNFGNNGIFSIKSTYKAMTLNDVGPYDKRIWMGKIPSKI